MREGGILIHLRYDLYYYGPAVEGRRGKSYMQDTSYCVHEMEGKITMRKPFKTGHVSIFSAPEMVVAGFIGRILL